MTSIDFQKMMDVADAITECKKLERFVKEKKWSRVVVQLKAINGLEPGEYRLLLEAHLPNYLLAACELLLANQKDIPANVLLEFFNTSDILCMNFTDPDICSPADSMGLLPFFQAGLVLAVALQRAQHKDASLLKASREASFVLSDTLNFIRTCKVTVDPLAKLMTSGAKTAMIDYVHLVQECGDVPTQLGVIDCTFRAANILRSKLCKSVSAGTAKSFLDTCFEAMFGFMDTAEARKFFTVKTNEDYFRKTRELVLKVNGEAPNVTSVALGAICITTKDSKKVELNSGSKDALYLDINKSSLSVVFPIDQEAVTISIPLREVTNMQKMSKSIRLYVKAASVEESLERWIEISEANAIAAERMLFYELAFSGQNSMNAAFETMDERKRPPKPGKTVKTVSNPKPISVLKPMARVVSKAAAPFGAGQLATICTISTTNDKRSFEKRSLESVDGDDFEDTEVESRASTVIEKERKETPVRKKSVSKKKQQSRKAKSTIPDSQPKSHKSLVAKPKGKRTDKKSSTSSTVQKQKTKAVLKSSKQKIARGEKILNKDTKPLLHSNFKNKVVPNTKVKEKSVEKSSNKTPAALQSISKTPYQRAVAEKPTVDFSDVSNWKHKLKPATSKDVPLAKQLQNRSKKTSTKAQVGRTPALQRWRENHKVAEGNRTSKSKSVSKASTKDKGVVKHTDDAASVASKKTISSVGTKLSKKSSSSRRKRKNSMHCPWKSSNKKAERKSLLDTGGFSDSETSGSVETKMEDSLLDIEAPLEAPKKRITAKPSLISPNLATALAAKNDSEEDLEFSVKNTVKELEHIAKTQFPDIMKKFFNKGDTAKWYTSGRPKWKKKEVVEVMRTSSEQKTRARPSAERNVETKEKSTSDRKAERQVHQKKSLKEAKEQDVQSLILEDYQDDFIDDEPEAPLSTKNPKRAPVVKSDIIQQVTTLSKNQKPRENVTRLTKPVEKIAPDALSKSDGSVITPIVAVEAVSKKYTQLKLIEKLFASSNNGIGEDGLKPDNIQWLRQMLSSYDETKPASVVKPEPQMQCRTGIRREIVWSYQKGINQKNMELGSGKYDKPKEVDTARLDINLEERFEAEESTLSSLGESSQNTQPSVDDGDELVSGVVEITDLDIRDLLHYGESKVEKARKRKRKEQKLLSRKIQRLQESQIAEQSKRVTKIRAHFARGQVRFLQKLENDHSVVAAITQHRQTLRQTWEDMNRIQQKRTMARERHNQLVEDFSLECSTAKKRLKELEDLITNELLVNRQACVRAVDKCKSSAKRYKSKYNKMHKQAAENRQRADVILMSLSKLST